MPTLPTITVNGITANIFADGKRKGITTGGGPWRVVVYQVAWDDSDNFMDALMGINVPAPPGGSIIFPQNHRYPLNVALACEEVELVEAIGAARPDPKLIGFDLAHVAATYRVPRYDAYGTDTAHAPGREAVPFGRWSIRGFIQEETVMAPGLSFVGDGGDGAGDGLDRPSLRIPIQCEEITLDQYMLPYLPDDLLASYGVCVNQGPFLGRAEGTVKFGPYALEPESAPDGSTVQRMNLVFTWRPVDWNARLRFDGTALVWDRVWDGTNFPLPYKDLTPLLFIGR